MEQNKKKSAWKGTLEIAVFVLIGVACGLFGVQLIDFSFLHDQPAHMQFFGYVLFFALIWIAYLLEIVLHEMGHMVCGLLSGYRFSSFRIGRTVLLKQNGKWTVKRFFLAGTGGQCLMVPPQSKDGNYPVVLYNLGGALANLVFGLAFLALTLLTVDVSVWLTVFCGANVFFGILYAALNGIPMRLSTVPNDGANVIALKKDPTAARAFCFHLQVNAKGYEGVRLKDMPAEWFDFPAKSQLKNAMFAESAVFACNRLMDEHRFAEAEEKMKSLLNADTHVAGIHKKLLTCDLIYCELIGACRNEVLVKYLTTEQFHFMRNMKDFPSVIRTEYAYALLLEQDTFKANAKKTAFEKISQSYPSLGDVLSERTLMEYAKTLAKERKAETNPETVE